MPPAPSVSCTAGVSSITWTWGAPAGATKYQTRHDLGTGLGHTEWVEQTTTSKTRSGLSGGSQLTLEVVAGNAAGWSGTDAATCTTSLPAPAAPSVSCTAGVSSIIWTWNAPAGATKYRTSYGFLSPWVEQTGRSKSSSGLSAGASATLYVQAGNASGWSGSDSASCTTVPGAPSVSCTATSSSITWSWSSVSGATKYQTRYDLGTGLGQTEWVEQTTTSKTRSGLSGGSQLTLQVEAGNTAGWSGRDSATCTTTAPAPSAPDVSCTRTTSSITWTWPAVAGATRYRFSYNGTTWTEQTNRTRTRSSLSSGTKLTLYVQAGNTSGWSTSDSATCTTSSSTGK